MITLDQIQRQMHRDEHPICPHCEMEIDMTDTERASGYVTYWGGEEPRSMGCPNCGVEIYLNERVRRSWTAGRTPTEAEEL